MRTLALWLCLMLLTGCTCIDRSHPYNAMPMPAEELTLNWGWVRTTNLYQYHKYEPGHLDTLNQLSSGDIGHFQLPVGLSIGLGKDYSAGFRYAYGWGPAFQGRGFDDLYNSSDNFQGKVFISKSIELEKGKRYLAVAPAFTRATGVQSVFKGGRLRYRYISGELPVTISQAFLSGTNDSLIISATGRVAVDRTTGMINAGGTEPYTYQDYPLKPAINIRRYAALGMVELVLDNAFSIVAQAGSEYVNTGFSSGWEPVFYAGFKGKIIDFTTP